MRWLARLTATLFTLLLIVALGMAGLLTAYRAPGPLTEKKVVLIARGEGLPNIAETLLYEGAICQEVAVCPHIFAYGSLLSGYRGKLKAGEYEIPAGASMADIARQMAEGRVLKHQITFPEGLTVQQIAALLKADPALTGDLGTLPPEGTLLPETYQYLRGDSRASILIRMAEAHKKLLAELWEKRAADLPFKTQAEAVTLASIVERETAVPEERARVAGVYLNRLRKNMLLQSDPTTIYGLSTGAGELGRPLTYNDLKSPSLYNTYVHPGLPPGPIANPGRASLEAALNPAHHNFLYFVANGTGGHAFAETLKAHNDNVARWRKLQQHKE